MSSAHDLFNDDDEEEEYEEDEEEEAYRTSRGKKRKRAKKQTGFLDIEADVGDDEDEEDEYEDMGGFVDEDLPEEHVSHSEYVIQQRGRRSPKLGPRRPFADLDDDAEAIAERLNHKYRNQAPTQSSAVVPQSLLLPGVDEAHLWLVRCKPGKERLAVDGMMRKFFEQQKLGKSLSVGTVFTLDSLKGYIYMEAMKMDDVKNAIQGVNHIYSTNMRLVPIKEMVDVLTISNKQSKKTENLIGKWVRIKKGKNKYSGDLAQVVDVDESGNNLTVKLVPRLDWEQLEKQEREREKLRVEKDRLEADQNPEGAKEVLRQMRRRRSVLFSGLTRPPQRFFNYQDVPQFLRGRLKPLPHRCFQLGSEVFDPSGFVEKQFRLSFLDVDDVSPTLEELARFSSGGADGEEEVDIEQLTQHLTQASPVNANGRDSLGGGKRLFLPGEQVEVLGEGISGTVQSTENNVALIRPNEKGFTGSLSVPLSQLVKKFKAGDVVRVLAGSHKDTTGMVVKVEQEIAWLIADNGQREIQTLTRDLGEATDVHVTARDPDSISGGARDDLPEYDLFDLVSYDTTNWGVIVKVDTGRFDVLNWNGEKIRVTPAQIRSKRQSKGTTTTDQHGIMLSVGDSVSVHHTRRIGTVLHIYKNNVWVRTGDVENNGVVAVQRNRVVAVNQAGQPIADDSRFAKTRRGRGRDRNGRGASPGRPSFGPRRKRWEMLQKTVKVQRGMYKGYLGIVKDVTDSMARVELHTNCKMVNVKLDDLQFGDSDGRPSMPSYGSGRMGSMSPAPMSGGRSPATWGNAAGTPNESWDNRAGRSTPSMAATARTPNPYVGAATPNPYRSFDSGSRTPGGRGDDDSWGSAPRTSDDAWAAGSKTPARPSTADEAWGMGNQTPARPTETSGDGWGESNAPANDFVDDWAGNSAAPKSGGSSGGGWGSPPVRAAPSSSANGWETPAAAPAKWDVLGSTRETWDVPGPGASDDFGGNRTGGPSIPTAEDGDLGNYGWAMPGIFVTVVPSRLNGRHFMSGEHDNLRGIVRSVISGGMPSEMVTVSDLEGNGGSIDAPAEFLEPERPFVKDMVKVLKGQHRGSNGSLMGLDGADGICKLDSGDGYIPVRWLAKASPTF